MGVGVKAKVAVKKPKAKISIKAKKPKAGLKLKVKGKKGKVGLKVKGKTGLKIKGKVGLKKKVKITIKKKSGPRFHIGAMGWSINAGQKLQNLDTSFKAFVKTPQAANWTGKVRSTCASSPAMKKWVAKLILSSTAQDTTWSKWYWSGAIQLNNAISNGKGSRFMKFMGKKLLGLKAVAKKIGIKVKGGLKVKGKVGLKVKGKTGLKIKAKKPKAGLKLKVKAK